jgi:DNA (cytosine-5)-methyltransferase 1
VNEEDIKINKLKVVELFAGIGAWGKALKKRNIPHETVYAVEFDKKTIESYNIIHNTNFEPQNITEINPSEVPDCDIVFYSPPCQAFSVAGRQEGFADQRGTLFFDALRIIQVKKPKYAIMENVKGLTGKKFEFEFDTMLQLLEQEGYKNYPKVLNAKDYGIPQNRERVFVVSIREDVAQEFNFPNAFDNGLRLRDLLEVNVEDKFFLSKEKTKSLLENYNNRKRKDNEPREISFDGEGLSYCIDANYAKGISENFVNSGRRTHIAISYSRKIGIGNEIDKAYTLNSSDWRGINRNQTQNAVLEIDKDDEYPYRIRKLTPLECLRLMGFEDKDYYKLKQNNVSNTQIYKMAGNSIVVNVIEEILENLFVHNTFLV